MERYREADKRVTIASISKSIIFILLLGVLSVLPDIIAGETSNKRDGKGKSAEAGRPVSWETVSKTVSLPELMRGAKEVPFKRPGPARIPEFPRGAPPPRSGGGTPVEDPSASFFNARPDQGIFRTPQAPGLLNDFVGLNQSGWYPPDPVLAVGQNHVVMMVNSSFAVFDKLSGARVLTSTLDAWFSSLSPPGGPYDPKVVYDHHDDHWIMLALSDDDVSLSYYLVSVSETSDPTGSWWNYKLDATLDGATQSNLWADYPGLGFDTHAAVYITSNQYQFGGSHQYAKLRILDKSELYTGAQLNWYDFFDSTNADGTKVFTWKPAHTFGSAETDTVLYLLNTTMSGADSVVTLWAVTDPLGSPPNLTRQASVEIGRYYGPPLASQPTRSKSICTNDCRTQDVIWQDGHLYTAFTEFHNFRDSEAAAIRYLKIDTRTNVAVEDIVYGANGIDYYFPAVYAAGNGKAVMVFNCSSSQVYAGVRYVGNFPADFGSASLKEGEGVYTVGWSNRWGGYRWGDYSGVGRDEDGSVWFCGEYARYNDSWGTWIGAIDAADLPMGLMSFIANGSEIDVEIDWETAAEINVAGFNVYRGFEKSGSYAPLNAELIPARGDRQSGSNYSFTDDDVVAGVTYYYWLETVDLRGHGSMEGPISAVAGSAGDDQGAGVTTFSLKQNYPNPFNPETVIRYDVAPGGGMVSIRVYDVAGHLVKNLVEGRQEPGVRSVLWDGRDNGGRRVSTGVYFYQMLSPGFKQTRKMVFLK